MQNKFAMFLFINVIMINRNPIIITGPITMFKIKFVIKKYGLNVFIFSRIIGNINNCAEIEIAIISLNLFNYFCILGFILYL